jgi:hypothetical protein
MWFFLSDLLQNDRTGIRRWDARRASAIFHFILTHHQNLSAQLRGISATGIAAFRYFNTDDLCPSEYIAILHGKELHHE